MNRRKAVVLSALGISVISVPLYLRFNSSGKEQLKPEHLLRIWDEESISVFGEKYLSLYPEENNNEILYNLLSDSEKSGDQEIADRLYSMIRSDFENEKMVYLDGWILSITEARQCAFYYLNS